MFNNACCCRDLSNNEFSGSVDFNGLNGLLSSNCGVRFALGMIILIRVCLIFTIVTFTVHDFWNGFCREH